jgi:photosystem II stability/assembly factor-like uncharacterized protein
MSDFPDIESRLRESLAEHARRAPDGSSLAEQVISTVTPPVRPLRRWRTWSLPLITAGAVAAVAGAVVGVVHATHSAAPRPVPPATTGSATVSAVPSAPTPLPSVTTSVPHSSAPPADSAAAIDLTFVADYGWAITQDGLLLRSTDDAATWTRVGTVPPDVAHLRFATTSTGYAFGQDVLYLTRDGGMTWTKQDGGALALETLDNNVIRVSTSCLPGCPMMIQTSAIGGATWTTTKTIQPGMSPGVTLTRTGSYAYLAVYGHTAGGAQDATTALWVSADNGATWADRGEPCPQAGGENDAAFLSTAPDGTVGVLCRPRQAGADWDFPMISPPGGEEFVAGGRQALGTSALAFALASDKVMVVSQPDGSERSTDAGQSFRRLSANSGSDPGPLQWLGFATPTVGHGLSQDGRTVWTTTDAGATWTPSRLP